MKTVLRKYAIHLGVVVMLGVSGGVGAQDTPGVNQPSATDVTNNEALSSFKLAVPPPPASVKRALNNEAIAAAPPPLTKNATTPEASPESVTLQDPEDREWDQKGLASWYAGRFQGRLTANGETFDTNALTAAHKVLPFDSIVEVYNPKNGRKVVVRINDRGPFVEGRIIDLSRAAASALDIAANGVAEVYLKVVRRGITEDERLHLIQIGSFSEHQNALDLMQDLRVDGFNPVIESTNQVFRVVIPDIAGKNLAYYQEQLANRGYTNVLVRTK